MPQPTWIVRLLLAATLATLTPTASSIARQQDAPAEGHPPGLGAFVHEVEPILRSKCLACHARGKYKGGLSIETREAILRGGEGGPAAVPGSAEESKLIDRVTIDDPLLAMPAGGDPLSAEEVAALRSWIDRGMPWPEGLSLGYRRAPLAPRRPDVPPAPPGGDLDHPIDRFVARYAAEHGIDLSWEAAPDRAFIRRASLDLIGLLPDPEEVERFVIDDDPGKVDRLVDRLLDDDRNYADHWLTFWNDLLRNAYRGTGFIDDGRDTITGWLYGALYENRPYDRFARDLVSPVPGSEGFTKGIVWRGVVNASQEPAMQAAQNVSQVFLATNLKCASCHDSFVNHWTLDDAYGLAAAFSEESLEIHRCDRPTGELARAAFIYPELGGIDPEASRAERMARLADLLVSPENGRFSRAIVNRLWAHFMGRGLVEPVDDLDRPPWDEDLLDWLAADFVEHGHDLRRTMRLIATSRAYRLPTVGVDAPSGREEFAFQGPEVKRMTAEQFRDAVSAVTGAWPGVSGELLVVDGRGQGGQLQGVRDAIAAARGEDASAIDPPEVRASWIWSHPNALDDPGGTIFVRKAFHLDDVPDRALVAATCDNELVVSVNGREVARGSEWSRPVAAEVSALLRPGENVVAIEATNWPDRDRGRGLRAATGPNPAGLIAWIGGFEGAEPSWAFGTDPSWSWSPDALEGWAGLGFGAGDSWREAVVLPDGPRTYPGVDLSASTLGAGATDDRLRAALLFDDPLLTALGRSNREQVVTRRDPIASTLQALELTNGETLDAILGRGAGLWIERSAGDPNAILKGVIHQALGREPTADERAIGLELIGSPPTPEGVRDFLWVTFMLPDFQLIH